MIIKHKRWIQAAQFSISGTFGLFAFTFGIAVLLFDIKDAQGQSAESAIIPCITIGSIMLFAASMALTQFIIMRHPVIIADASKVSVLLVGHSPFNRMWFMPKVIRLFFLIISGKGFSANYFQAQWIDVSDVLLVGLPGMRKVVLKGRFTNALNASEIPGIALPDALIAGDLQVAVNTMNQLRIASYSKPAQQSR